MIPHARPRFVFTIVSLALAWAICLGGAAAQTPTPTPTPPPPPPYSPPDCGLDWRRMSHPEPLLNVTAQLFGVAPVSENDVWAVGTYRNESGANLNTLVKHWDGGEWRIVSSPNPGPQNALMDVSALSATDV